MNKKNNKYMYLWTVKGYYCGTWEELYSSESYNESFQVLKDYSRNDNSTVYKMIYERVLNAEYERALNAE